MSRTAQGAMLCLTLLLAHGAQAHADATGTAPDSQAATASDATPMRIDVAMFGLFSTPFHAHDGGAGLGFGLGPRFGVGSIPLMLGVDFMASYLGTLHSEAVVRFGDTTLLANTSRQDKLYFFDATLRLQWPHWLVRPYLEGVLAAAAAQRNYAFSFVDNPSATASSSSAHWTSSAGWGAGLDFHGLYERAGDVFLTLGFRRMTAGHTSVAATTEVNDQSVSIRRNVPTDTTVVMLGVGSHFGAGN